MNNPRFDLEQTTKRDIARPSAEVLEKASRLPSATLHEAAGRIGVLPSAIKPVSPHFKVCGPAVTVHSPGGDNLWLHRALYVAQPGDVLVIHVSGDYDYGYWGEVMSTAAKAQKLAGMVIDGCVRDVDLLCEMGFPVFARGLCIRGTGKDFSARGWINAPTLFDDVVVNAGDLIVGDNDGVVCIPREDAAAVVEKSVEREEWETGIMQRLEQGETSLSLFGWD